MFNIVIFKKTIEVDIVPSSWCTNEDGVFTILWPSGMAMHKISTFIKKDVMPKWGNWNSYEGILKGTAETYETAIQTRRKAEIVSEESDAFSAPEKSSTSLAPYHSSAIVRTQSPPVKCLKGTLGTSFRFKTKSDATITSGERSISPASCSVPAVRTPSPPIKRVRGTLIGDCRKPLAEMNFNSLQGIMSSSGELFLLYNFDSNEFNCEALTRVILHSSMIFGELSFNFISK